MAKCTFHGIKPRHYSINQLQKKLEESICVFSLRHATSSEKELWLAEAAILCELDVALDHVRFTKLEPFGPAVRLKVVGTAMHTTSINRVYTISD